jgi:Ca2+-binding RTX toxin-like protein
MHTPNITGLEDITTTVTNPYFPLEPGATYFYENPDGSELVTIEVLREPIMMTLPDGTTVSVLVVRDTVTERGKIVEVTEDYFAQDSHGNVVYFGEDVTNFLGGNRTDNAGSWLAGDRVNRDDANIPVGEPGFIMLANPRNNHEYDQENAPGVAEDHAMVISRTEAVDNIPYIGGGSFDSVLQILETTPLEPSAREHKFYAPGIGLVQVVDANTGEVLEQLVRIRFEGTENNDTLVGRIGTDELFGFGGDDTFIWSGGNDTATGGAGNDTYVVHLTDGRLTINDFQAGGPDDVIDFSGTSLSFADVQMTRHGNDTVLAADDISILLTGVRPNQLTENDFLFA